MGRKQKKWIKKSFHRQLLVCFGVVAVMGVVVLLGIIYGLIPVLTFTQGLLTGQKSIQRASEAEEKSVWITALQMDRFFRQKKMDQLFREYRDKVKQQRQKELEEYKKYVKTKKFVEEVAKNKFGLLYPDEILSSGMIDI